MPRVYTPPNFNAVADVWNPPLTPATDPPSFTAVACQVYAFSRTPQTLFHPGTGRWLPTMIIRIPITYPVQVRIDSIWRPPAVPAQATDYYKVQYLLRMHTGFPNQYLALLCLLCNANGTLPRTPLPT